MKFYRIEGNKHLTLGLLSELETVTGIDIPDLIKILRYNVITPKVLALITRRDVSTILNLQRDGKFETVYPFQIGEIKGAAFIYFNEDVVQYINQTLK